MRPTLAGALAAVLVAGCGAARHEAPDPPRSLLQVANGPVAVGPGPRPLAVDLSRGDDPVRVHFRHPPREGLLFDLDTGRVLWRRNPERILPIASLTKMMTALLVAGRLPERARARITRVALHYQGSAVGVLPPHRLVRVQTLLYGLLLPSGNDAARALAMRVAGTLPAFVAMMNARAQEMGLRCTHYTSADGFRDAGNHSCAVDLAAEARAVLDSRRLAPIVRTRDTAQPLPIKGGRVYLSNNNPLLRLGYPGTIGIKTGYTDAAGRCLVAAVRRYGHRLGVVLLHSPDTGRQAAALFDRGFRLLG